MSILFSLLALLALSFAAALICVAVKRSMNEGHILHGLYNWLVPRIGKYWIAKPIISCVYCFPTFWGTLFYLSVMGVSVAGFVVLPFYWLLTNGMIWWIYPSIHNKLLQGDVMERQVQAMHYQQMAMNKANQSKTA